MSETGHLTAHSYYESDRALSEYLLFHYGGAEDLLPPGLALADALNFPARCVTTLLDAKRLPARARALDLGCAVGRASFELARTCSEVVGVDFSERFITLAGHLQKNGSFIFPCIEEGEITRPCQAVVPPEIDRSRVKFQRGDALDLPRDFGGFDVILLGNLLDRLRDPRRCLEQLPRLLNPAGQLLITSPYTWLPEYTPKLNWLGGYFRGRKRVRTFDALKEILSPNFDIARRQDLPFVIREHARKFQLCIADGLGCVRK